MISEALANAGFSDEGWPGRIVLAPGGPKPRIDGSGRVFPPPTEAGIRALWPVLPIEPRIKRVILELPPANGSDPMIAAFIECMTTYIPPNLHVITEVPHPNIIPYLAQVRHLTARRWNSGVDVLLSQPTIPSSLTLENCYLSTAMINRLAELIADGSLHCLDLDVRRRYRGSDYSDLTPIAQALRSPQCKLISLSFEGDAGSFFQEAIVAPSLREFLYETEDIPDVCAFFIQDLERLEHIRLYGRVANLETFACAIRKHTTSLKWLNLMLFRVIEVSGLYAELLRNPENQLETIAIWGIDSPEPLPWLTEALTLNTSKLRKLNVGGQHMIPGLIEAISKSLINKINGMLPGMSEFREALGSEWFRVLETLLSIQFVKRISKRSDAVILPIADFIPRIAQTLGWTLERAHIE